MPTDTIPEPDEVTLADIVRVLWRRRFVLLTFFLLVLGGAVAYTLLKSPLYKSEATVIANEQLDVIQHWLESNQAATSVAQSVGNPLLSRLFPDDWSAQAGTWKSQPPSPERAGRAIGQLSDVTTATRLTNPPDRIVKVTVTYTDAGLARDIANAYLASLERIRPQLQNVTESQLFVQFYDGTNEPDARRQAHEVALAREYWIVVDPAFAAEKPSSPNVQLNIALGIVLGLMAGVVAAFIAEWIAGYRLSGRAPTVPESAGPAAAASSTGAFRYRGK